MNAGPQIRRYEDGDFEETLTLWRSVSAATYTFFPPELAHTEAEDRAYFAGHIAPNELWVAEEETRITAYMALEDDLIDRLYVAVDQQRRGVGTALLEHAKALRPEGIRLFAHRENTGARRFYEKHEFVVFRLGLSPPPESLPDVEYRWSGNAL